MNRQTTLAVSLGLISAVLIAAAPVIGAAAPNEADPFMGEYIGTYAPGGGKPDVPARALAIPEKHKDQPFRYRVKVIIKDRAFELLGEPKGGKVELRGKNGGQWTGRLANRRLTASAAGGASLEAEFTLRKSPTEGKKPPAGAVVLLPYTPGKPTALDAWRNKNWKRLPDGSAQVYRGSNLTVRDFGACRLHVEFMTPYEPHRFGQGRGNSGVYLQGRYEVQVLDSYGLEGKDNECGGIYKVGAPLVNMCLPPGQWQTYDMTFHAPPFNAGGEKTGNAVVTVRHNGVPIHDERPIPGPTGGALDNNAAEPGGIYLQDHGNPVQFRNIWIVELN